MELPAKIVLYPGKAEIYLQMTPGEDAWMEVSLSELQAMADKYGEAQKKKKEQLAKEVEKSKSLTKKALVKAFLMKVVKKRMEKKSEAAKDKDALERRIHSLKETLKSRDDEDLRLILMRMEDAKKKGLGLKAFLEGKSAEAAKPKPKAKSEPVKSGMPPKDLREYALVDANSMKEYGFHIGERGFGSLPYFTEWSHMKPNEVPDVYLAEEGRKIGEETPAIGFLGTQKELSDFLMGVQKEAKKSGKKLLPSELQKLLKDRVEMLRSKKK